MALLDTTERPAPTARPRVAATLILASVGAFVTSLDVVVVSTALPSLRVHLGASLSDLKWTINAYNLAFASLMLTGAALGDRFGRRRLYVTGLALFTAASIACATASSAGALIAARTVQGAGAAIVLPVSLTLISEAFPAEKRGNQVRAPRRRRGGAGRGDPGAVRPVAGRGAGEHRGRRRRRNA